MISRSAQQRVPRWQSECDRAHQLVALSGDEAVARSALARTLLCHIGHERIVAFAMPGDRATEGVKSWLGWLWVTG
jgi:hypothetical protein